MQSSRQSIAAGACIFCKFARRSIARNHRSAALHTTARVEARDSLRFGDDDHGDRGFRIRKFGSSKGFKPPPGDEDNKRNRPGNKKGYGLRKGREPEVNFTEVLTTRLKVIRQELKKAPIAKTFEAQETSFDHVWKLFSQRFFNQDFVRKTGGDQRLYTELKAAFKQRGEAALDDRIKYAFYGHVTRARFTETDIKNQMALADLRYPSEWYPATRQMHRQIHLHVGPTNSGKTYHALKRLEAAESGIYAGPLRLLAHEVYTRLNAQGKRCVLVTGEERRSPDESLATDMSSCTVEMMPLNKTVDVAVIDEIQMIGNTERGWAWTQAVLGVKANEVHLCGEARTVPLIKELCASVGEKVIVHEYERLSPLQVADKSLEGNFKDLRKGDCIVSFSVVGIHALRRQIEQATRKKVAIVYGSLPPETRAQQARLFNDPDNDFDYLVASDAVGMGLNLSIKRIIFEEAAKFDGVSRKTLPIADIKQIAGRAGRYRSAFQANAAAAKDLAEVKGESEADTAVERVSTLGEAHNGAADATPPPKDTRIKGLHRREASRDKESYVIAKAGEAQRSAEGKKEETSTATAMASRAPTDTESVGLVTTLEKFDFPIIESAMSTEPEPIRTAGLFPPGPIVERFATYFPPGTPFSFILLRLHELSQMHSRFHLCGLKDQLYVADLIEPIQDLTTADRIVLCACPVSRQDKDLFKELLPALARCIEQQGGGDLLDIPEMPLEVLELEASPSRNYLRQLELLHKGIIAYLWLSYRFSGVFPSRPLAFHVKSLVEEKIETVLSSFSFTEMQREKIRKKKEKKMQALLAENEGKEAQEGKNDQDDELDENDNDDESPSSPRDSQTSIVSGGDHFSGEEDLGIFDDAIDDSVSHGRDFDPKRGTDGMDTERLSATTGTLADANEAVGSSGPTASGTMTPVNAADAEAQAALSPEEPILSSSEGVTPEIETEKPDAMMEAQEAPPSGIEDEQTALGEDGTGRTRKDGKAGKDGKDSAPVEGMPPKHFQEIDTSAADVERDVASRP